jgi:subtilisin family serine protease
MFLCAVPAAAEHVSDEIIIKFKPVKISSIIAFEKINQLNDMPLSYRTVLKALDVKELKPLYKEKTSVLVDKLNKKIMSQSLQTNLTRLDLKRLNRIQRYVESKQQGGDDRAFVLKVKAGTDIEQVIKQLELQPEVESVQKNIIYQTFVNPNDPQYLSNQQTAFNSAHMNIANAWDISTGNGTVIVAVIDTGFKVDHPELTGQFWVNPGDSVLNGVDDDNNGKIDDINGWNFYDGTNLLLNSCSEGDHGTRVSSIIGAITNNGANMAGINWNAKIMGLRVFSSSCVANTVQITQAIDYAMAMGADVINMSLGGTGNDPSFESKCLQAYNAGIVLVASMGNVGGAITSKDTLIYPAAYPTVIGVGSVSQALQPSSFSVRGISPYNTELVAVGENMCVARNDNSVVCNSIGTGTSFSSPVVAGVASLLLTKEPTLTPLQLRTRLQNTATDVNTAGYDIDTGYGLVNAYNALTNTTTTVNIQSNHLDNLRHYPNPVQQTLL